MAGACIISSAQETEYSLFEYMHEAQFRYQSMKFRRCTQNDRIRLGEILDMFEVGEDNIRNMAVLYREANEAGYEKLMKPSSKLIKNASKIMNYDLFSAMLKRKKGGYYTDGHLHQTTLVLNLVNGEQVILGLKSMGGTDNVKYMRVNILIPDLIGKYRDDGRTLKSGHLPYACSMLLSYIQNPDDLDFLNTVDATEKSLLEKLSSGEEWTDEERFLYIGAHECFLGEYLGMGEYATEMGYYSFARKMLEQAVEFYAAVYDVNDEDLVATYKESCKTLADVCEKLGDKNAASYYNNIAEPEGHWVVGKGADHQSVFTDKVTMRNVLLTMRSYTAEDLEPYMFIYDCQKSKCLKSVQDISQIMDTPLNVAEAADKVYVLSIRNRDSENSVEDPFSWSNQLVVETHKVLVNGEDMIRVDMMECQMSAYDFKMHLNDDRIIPWNASFVLGYSDGLKIDFERESASECFNIAYERFSGSDRSFERYRFYRWIFDYMQDELNPLDEQSMRAFYYYTFKTGDALVDLMLPEKGELYLELAQSCGDKGYFREWINSLVNSNDPRAISTIKAELEKVDAEPESDNIDEERTVHRTFLLRRLSYVLIEKGFLDEAETVLKDLATYPDMKEYVEGELKYIEEERAAQKAE